MFNYWMETLFEVSLELDKSLNKLSSETIWTHYVMNRPNETRQFRRDKANASFWMHSQKALIKYKYYLWRIECLKQ